MENSARRDGTNALTTRFALWPTSALPSSPSLEARAQLVVLLILGIALFAAGRDKFANPNAPPSPFQSARRKVAPRLLYVTATGKELVNGVRPVESDCVVSAGKKHERLMET